MTDFSLRIRAAADRLGLPACLVTDTPDLFYLTGADLEGFWLLLTPGGAVAFAPALLADQVGQLLPFAELVPGNDLVKNLTDYCRKKKIRALSLDASRVTYALALRLGEKLTLENRPGMIDALRMVKDAGEIARIRRACALAARAAEHAYARIRPGVTEGKIAAAIDTFFARHGAKPSFTTIVASGPNTALPHHLSSGRKIGKDDGVMIDLGCVLDGYCSDLTRTYFFGRMGSLQKKVYNIVDKAQKKAVKSVRPGMKASEVDAVARDIIAQAGYGDRFIHSTGHGVGVEIHEAPRISTKDTTVLKEGMVVTIEPGIYLPGRFGVRIEDSILITNKGCEVLTR